MPSSSSDSSIEHFVTLFDNNFLPMGLCLHASLMKHGQPFHLWILCMDELVEQNLRLLALPFVSLIPLAEVENARLLAVKPSRSRGEYCWTLTPFTPQFVFDREPGIERVTYLDADLLFFDKPNQLLDEFTASSKHVLITDHAYDPRYERSGRARRGGKFCVQFMTFRRTVEAARVMHWWQDRCLEWCYARAEDGKFGDQKYLDVWPELFSDEVHILLQKHKTLAPWNVKYMHGLYKGQLAPVFYHYQTLKIEGIDSLCLYSGYNLGNSADLIYQTYVQYLRDAIRRLDEMDISVPYMPRKRDFISKCIALKRRYVDGEQIIPLRS